MRYLIGIALFWSCQNAFAALVPTDKDYSFPMNCNVAEVNDGYAQDHYDNFMFCQKDVDRILNELQAHYSAVLKIEGLDGLAMNLLNHQPQTYGEECHTQLKIRVVGIEDESAEFKPSAPKGPTSCDQPRD